MLVNMDALLKDAKNKGYAIPQFNINNLEWTRFILEECQNQNSPVILGVSEKSVQYIGGFLTVVNMVKGLIIDLNIKIPVVLHLDHGRTFNSCKCAINCGFTSVMIDASSYDLKTNIKITNEVTSYASKYNVSVEAELGFIDNVNEQLYHENYTKIDEFIEFINNTKATAIAPSIGNRHGIYNSKPNLNLELLSKIHKITDIPLVLHGASSLSDDIINKVIKLGICKININSDLQRVWTNSVRNFLNKNKTFDPRNIIKSGESNMKELIKNKILLFGSNNKIDII